jgi:hypothetical protein
MATSEEMSSLFPIFILSVLGLFVIPWTIYRLSKFAQNKKKITRCMCSICTRSAKYRTSFIGKVNKFSMFFLSRILISYVFPQNERLSVSLRFIGCKFLELKQCDTPIDVGDHCIFGLLHQNDDSRGNVVPNYTTLLVICFNVVTMYGLCRHLHANMIIIWSR